LKIKNEKFGLQHRRGGLRAISCQAEKQFERKDAHRKPLLPTLGVADVAVAQRLIFNRVLSGF
jgi:hypothetical protein